MSEYTEKADKFLKDTGTKFSVRYIEHRKYFPDDEETRDVYRFTFSRGGKRWSGTFGQSIAGQGKEPSAYDVLVCLTKYDPGTFENFCSDYGCDTDSRIAESTYKAVHKEWFKVSAFWTEKEIKTLAEIN